MGAETTSVDMYLAALEDGPRAALARLRSLIREGAPAATELIAYGMPAFKQDGRFLVSYAAFKDHCSLFPASDGVRVACGESLQPYLSGKGTIRFEPAHPLPAELVRGVVEARLAEVLREADRS